jgi:hypothetical protein
VAISEVEMNESELFEHIDVMLESIHESEKIHDNLQEKADNSGIEFDTIFEKFLEEDTVEEAYQRLNSFIANEGKTPGLWDNIHKKRKRIKAGSNERMRSPGDKGAPTNAAFKAANEEASSWKTDGHYLKNGKEWDGDQHAYEGEVYTGKEHGPDSERLYHYKELSPNIRNAIDDSLKENEHSWNQDFANEFSELSVKDEFNLHPSMNESLDVDESKIDMMINKNKYKRAIKLVKDLHDDKNNTRDFGHLAGEVVRMYNLKLDIRTLAKMAMDEEYGAGEKGTDKLVKKYKKDTPGEC